MTTRGLTPKLLALGLLLTLAAVSLVVAADYRGNVKSKIFHAPHCRFYNCKACTVAFSSPEEAKKAGYKPCKVCNP